ncbi:MFS transporter [Mesorhizobium sp. B292B1B]|uniref:MFS transporter n=1 Tax=unclassified Mesorhizobium TaxID=325217 RepID=UPI00112E2091|nr:MULTISPECIES: MFS transporter [unclassified Mesorhizobium]MCA0013083.1 MFS transporter [Mesorhizobium sp. B294B1A1]MCA0040259.1 MFS transporter [Mesorhizobium sp. B292B1B]TPM45159.1 MFS transporter [Mesorhizobium sp. B2-3-2]
MSVEMSSKNEVGAPDRLDWRLMLPLFAVVTLYAAGIGAVLPVLPFYLREMGASPFVFGLVLSTEALSQSAASPLLGQLSDRFGRKRVLLASQMVAVVSLLLLAQAQSILAVLLARFLFGFTAGNFSAAAAYAADNSSAMTRRQAIGVVNAGLGLGGTIGAGFSSILSEISLTTPIYMALALSASGVVVTTFGLNGGKVMGQGADGADREKVSLRAVTSSPVIRVLMVVMLCHFLAYGMYTSQLPIFLADRFVWNGHALGPSEFSYIIAADGVINILVQLFLLRRLGRFFSERRLIILIFALICTGFVSAGMASTIPVLAFAVLCISTGDALAKPTYLAALSVHVSSERQGVAIGTGQALVAVTDIASPVLAGFILGLGLYEAWSGVVVAIAIVGAIIAATRLPRHADPEIAVPAPPV